MINAVDVIHQIESLPVGELGKVRDWFWTHEAESPELLAAVDEGLRSLDEKGARSVTQENLLQKVHQWAGV
jgi:hypothetical protein